jgi:transposase InsO family protein
MDVMEAHYRMGHLGETALRLILNHHEINATGKFKNCISCLKWKGGNKRVSEVDVNPAEYPEERLHVDASGPLPLTQGRQAYWSKIKDAYNGYSWGYSMANKSSTGAILRQHMLYLKTRGMRIKTVSCDNAKEQMKPLKNMCWELGVQIDYVAPYTPQQNGKVERQFPTDLKRANAMFYMVKFSAGIKQKLRKEAIRYATTMANISIKNNKSPHERFFWNIFTNKTGTLYQFWKNWICYTWTETKE